MADFYIDWDNLPVCGDPEIVISSAYCVVDDGWHPPVDPPTPVPVPGTLALLAIGLLLMRAARA